MKNIAYTLAAIACIGLIIYGVAARKQVQLATENAEVGQSTEVSKPGDIATTAPAIIGQVANRYRPDAPEPVAGTKLTAAEQAERDFLVTPELLAKLYLIDRFKPGICFGAPIAVPQSAVSSLVNSNPPQSDYLKRRYGLSTDMELYNKIKQIQGVTLAETASSRYDFSFVDGQCRNVTLYKGVVTVAGGSASASVSSQESHTYQ